MKKILLLGKNGQVGFELQRSLAVLGEIVAFGRDEADLAKPGQVETVIRESRPDVVVNAAAYTAVDKAEQEPSLAALVNAEAVGAMADAARSVGALVVHYSTDYVFDGTKPSAYLETDVPDPRSVYGRTKLAGERLLQERMDRHFILRTSWVFGAYGGNFLKTMLRLMREKSELRVVGDQHGAPTCASLIADVTAHIIKAEGRGNEGGDYGIYHLAASGETSWFHYARLIAELAIRDGLSLSLGPEDIKEIPASEFPAPAPRPANSRLDTKKLQDAFGLRLPNWQVGVRQTVALLSQSGR